MTKKPSVYIASKMSGIPAFNFPAFDHMRVLLCGRGFDVISPADIDRAHGFDGTAWMIENPDWDYDTLPSHLDYEAILRRDFDAIEHSDAIVLFGDWRNSKGAIRELEHAKSLGLTAIDATEDGWLELLAAEVRT